MARTAPVLAALLLAPILAFAPPPLFAQKSSGETRARQFAKLPYWDGLWLTENDETTIGGHSEVALAAREKGQNPTSIMQVIGGLSMRQ